VRRQRVVRRADGLGDHAGGDPDEPLGSTRADLQREVYVRKREHRMRGHGVGDLDHDEEQRFLRRQIALAGEDERHGLAPAAAFALLLLHDAGNGNLTLACGTLPLAIFGPENYAHRLGLPERRPASRRRWRPSRSDCCLNPRDAASSSSRQLSVFRR